jgi:hypothetical protein
MTFDNTYISREHRYLLGVHRETGVHFEAIPVSNSMVDYVEAYKISDDEYEEFMADEQKAIEFAESCRRHEQDDRLFLRPGSDRGVPR